MDDQQFDDVVRSIASGSSVDWNVLDSSPADASMREVLRELRIISQIAGVHDAAGRGPGLPPPLVSGQSWGPLTVLELIGRGAFADVYRARDERLDRDVALKVLRTGEAGTAGVTVIEEGRLLARVHHPNVVTVHGADRIDERVGIWMELVRGRTLERVLREQGPLDAPRAAAIGVEVLRGLSALHQVGLVHRDVKAANVMRADGGRIVLMDLGAGQPVTEGSSGDLAGTPLYVAPELLEGTPATARSDVYSVGVLLYHLVSAAYPVRAATLAEIREAHRQKQRTPLRDVRPDLPRQFVEVVERATAVAPTERFESPAAFETALMSSVTPGLGLLPKVATRGRVVATLAILGITLGLGAFALLGRSAGSVQARLGFQPRDFVLITRFENRTGEPIFDGAIEYALERELNDSDVVGLVPGERVDDALRFMKRPLGTVIDRPVGREVALRDGHIKALLAGRIERFGSSYVLSAQLVDPANDSVVATIGEEATGQPAVLAALRRQATRVRVALGEHRDRITGADPDIEPAATESLRAFQLYNKAYQLGRQNQWRAARELAHQLVEVDPEFASGWIWLAWSIRNTEPNTAIPSDAQISRYREYIERALHLADRLPEWERHWVTGSYYTLLGDHAKAIPHYEALIKLRPDHYYAYNNLLLAVDNLRRPEDARERIRLFRRMADQRVNDTYSNMRAAVSLIMEKEGTRVPNRYLDRLRVLAESKDTELAFAAQFWRDFTTAYDLYYSGELGQALEQTGRIARSVPTYPQSVRPTAIVGVINYYLSLGRLSDASRFAATLSSPSEKETAMAFIALETGDGPTLRRLLQPYTAQKPPHQLLRNPSIYIRAGLLDRAQDDINHRGVQDGHAEVARGELLLLRGRHEQAIKHLERGLELMYISNNPAYWWGCESLADALWRVRRQAEAVETLETCSGSSIFKDNQAWAPLGNIKMSVDLHLADLYRQVGRIADAQTIEQRIRRRHALADPDYFLLQRLNNR